MVVKGLGDSICSHFKALSQFIGRDKTFKEQSSVATHHLGIERNVRFDVLKALKMLMFVCWFVTPCGLIRGGRYCLPSTGRRQYVLPECLYNPQCYNPEDQRQLKKFSAVSLQSLFISCFSKFYFNIPLRSTSRSTK
jgi:hypothetical protein